MIYTTSDLHFFHKKILVFAHESRPFNDIDEMHGAMINNWNNLISPDDTTYILGDVSFGGVTGTVDILNSLNGKKILIVGNHDESYLRKERFTDCFESIHQYLEIKHNGYKICLMHYPIAWHNLKHHGSMMLHGHLHGNPSYIEGRIKDVGMDCNNCTPFLLDDVVNELIKIPVHKDHHGRDVMP